MNRLGLCFAIFLVAELHATVALAQDSGTLGPAPPASKFVPFSVPTSTLPTVPIPGPGNMGQFLTLEQSLNEALAGSPRMSSVRALLGIARANFAQALTFPNPGLYIVNNYQYTYYLGASIPVEPPWKVVFRLLLAKKQLEQAKLEILRQMWAFRSEVRRGYANVVMNQELLSARKELLSLAEKIWQTSQKHFENGNVPGLDVRRAKFAFIQAKMDCEQAEIKLSQAREQLNLLMGRKEDAAVSVPSLPAPALPGPTELLPDFKKQFPTSDEYVKIAGENRLELKIAKQVIAVNQANLKNAIGNILPTPRFVVGRLVETNPPTGPKDQVPFMQAYIDTPLLDFQQGNIARFKAAIQQGKYDLQGQENLVVGQVKLAYKNLIAARQRIKAFHDEALPEADGMAAVARKGYELGHTDLNSLLDAQRTNIQTRSQYLDAVLNYQLAINDLEQAVGVPLQ